MALNVTHSVCDVFRRRIQAGEMKVGDAFPSIRRVAAQHNLAHATAVRVIDQLIAEGYIERHGKRPAVVRGVPKRSLMTGLVYAADEANFKHPATTKLLYALTEAHMDHGHRMQMLPVRNGDWSDALDFARECQTVRPGGVFTFGGLGTDRASEQFTVALRGYGVPVVQFETRLNEMSSIWPLVTFDLAKVGGEAINIFHRLGRCRIGAIVGRWSRVDKPHSLLHGVDEQMKQLGLRWDESCYERVASWSESSGREAAARLLDKGDFDALLCQDDVNALGVLREFKARGLRTPDDVALIGVGDLLSPESGAVLSTFDLQYARLAREAVRLIEQQVDGETLSHHDVVVPPAYISRKTCPARLPAIQAV